MNLHIYLYTTGFLGNNGGNEKLKDVRIAHVNGSLDDEVRELNVFFTINGKYTKIVTKSVDSRDWIKIRCAMIDAILSHNKDGYECYGKRVEDAIIAYSIASARRGVA